MNTFYEQKTNIHSNNDIFESYFLEGKKTVSPLEKALDRLLTVLAICISFLASARTVACLRICGVAFSLVAFIGVIGAMETGALALLPGVIIGLGLCAVEFLCLRRH